MSSLNSIRYLGDITKKYKEIFDVKKKKKKN